MFKFSLLKKRSSFFIGIRKWSFYSFVSDIKCLPEELVNVTYKSISIILDTGTPSCFTHVFSCISVLENLMFTKFEYLTFVTFLGRRAIKPDEGAARLSRNILNFYHATQLQNHSRARAVCYRSFTSAEGVRNHLRVESVLENVSLEDFSPIVSAFLCPYNSSNAPHSYFIHSPPTQLQMSLN